jgi:hypothetical protein
MMKRTREVVPHGWKISWSKLRENTLPVSVQDNLTFLPHFRELTQGWYAIEGVVESDKL